MSQDLRDNFPSSKIELLAINEIRADGQNDLASSLADIPFLQDIDANQDNLSDTWEAWSVQYRDVQIIDSTGEFRDVLNLTNDGNLTTPEDYAKLREMIVDVATANNTAGSQWQNAREPFDINGDDNVSPIDLREVINTMNDGGPRNLTADVTAMVDLNGDSSVSARDALGLVLHLNAVNDRLSAGEPPATSQVDAFLASMAASADQDDEGIELLADNS